MTSLENRNIQFETSGDRRYSESRRFSAKENYRNSEQIAKKGIQENTYEGNKDVTIETEGGINIPYQPRRVSESFLLKGKLDVLLKKHDDELVRRHYTKKEEVEDEDEEEEYINSEQQAKTHLHEESEEEHYDVADDKELIKESSRDSIPPNLPPKEADSFVSKANFEQPAKSNIQKNIDEINYNGEQREKQESKEMFHQSDEHPSEKAKTYNTMVDDPNERYSSNSIEQSSMREASSNLNINHQSNPLTNPKRHTGILQKKNSSPFWSWKRHTFVLEGKVISFYDQQQDSDQLKSKKGSIDLNTVTSVQSKKPGLLKSHFPFTLERKSEGPIILAADSSEDQELWMKLITEELQRPDQQQPDQHAPEQNKRGEGSAEKYAREATPLPARHRTSAYRPTSNIQDEDINGIEEINENLEAEEEPENKSDKEEEKPVLIVPKKIRGVGVMSFAPPVGAVNLRNVSYHKKQEKEYKDTEVTNSDRQEMFEKDEKSIMNKPQEMKGVRVMGLTPQGGGVQLRKVSNPNKPMVNKETDADPIASEQGDAEEIFGVKLKKTERNLTTGNDKSRKDKKISTPPIIPLSKNLQSVVSKNKDDEGSESKIKDNNNIIYVIKKDSVINTEVYSNNKVNLEYKSKENIDETNEESIKKEIQSENYKIISNEPSSDISKDPQPIEFDVQNINNESNENQIVSENYQIPSNDKFSAVTNQPQTTEFNVQKLDNESNENKIVSKNYQIHLNGKISAGMKDPQTIEVNKLNIETNENNMYSENVQIPPKDSPSAVTKEHQTVEVCAVKLDHESHETNMVPENIKLPSENPTSAVIKELQTVGVGAMKLDNESTKYYMVPEINQISSDNPTSDVTNQSQSVEDDGKQNLSVKDINQSLWDEIDLDLQNALKSFDDMAVECESEI